jgi:hypothetical protein
MRYFPLPRCVTLRHPPSSLSLLKSSAEIMRARVLISREITRPAKIALALRSKESLTIQASCQASIYRGAGTLAFRSCS